VLAALLAFAPMLATASDAPASLLAVDRDGDALLVLDPDTLALRHRVTVGNAPHEVVGNRDGTRAFVANYGDGAAPGDSISVVDPVAGTELARLDVRPFLRPHGLALRGDKLYFTSEATRSVVRLDTATGKVDWVVGTGESIGHMLELDLPGARVFTANMLSGTVTAVAIAHAPQQPLRHVRVGDKPEGLALAPDGQSLWVGLNGEGRIVVLDAATLAERARIEAGVPPARLRFTPDGRLAFTCDPQHDALLVFDARTHALLERVPLPGAPLGLWPSADSRSAWITLAGTGEVVRIELQEFTVTARGDVGQVADGIGWAGPPGG
jgi:DNA-binding beta-propeller fold protein YncE